MRILINHNSIVLKLFIKYLNNESMKYIAYFIVSYLYIQVLCSKEGKWETFFLNPNQFLFHSNTYPRIRQGT